MDGSWVRTDMSNDVHASDHAGSLLTWLHDIEAWRVSPFPPSPPVRQNATRQGSARRVPALGCGRSMRLSPCVPRKFDPPRRPFPGRDVNMTSNP